MAKSWSENETPKKLGKFTIGFVIAEKLVGFGKYGVKSEDSAVTVVNNFCDFHEGDRQT